VCCSHSVLFCKEKTDKNWKEGKKRVKKKRWEEEKEEEGKKKER
jgi:hypothetical protein